MASHGGNRVSPEAILQARERERQVVQLFLRGLSWMEIGRQLAVNESTVRKAFDRAVKRIPPKDVELLRKLQSERLNDARRRVYTELAGREEVVPDPANPGAMKKVTIRPSIDEVNRSIDRILSIEIREANLYGLDAPRKSDIVNAFVAGGQLISDEELERQWYRLTEEEQETFMRLLAKLQGRLTEPAAEIEDGSTVETTATPVEQGGEGNG
jgi:DNA-binding CsgD family transcriptional regulator